ncbi:MAG: hypothetical protein Q4F29_01660 [Lachnospiraceae bacterium]|nr:hypothetical protein [Lachnospiraceae bacterium]
MLKLEIKMDENKIQFENQYLAENIYQMLAELFDRFQLKQEILEDGTLSVHGNNQPWDYGAFGYIITLLKDKMWFMPYVIKWVWYNSDNNENEEDFDREDVLYYYTKKVSAA